MTVALLQRAEDRTMYHVRQRDFGYVLTLTGAVRAAELKSWYDATHDHLRGRDGPFGVLVDAQRCRPLSKVARFWLLRGQHVCEEAGLARAAVLVDSTSQDGYWPGLMAGVRRDPRVRFIDATRSYPRVRALSWILKRVEPTLYEGNGTAQSPVSSSSLPGAASVQTDAAPQ